MTLRAWRIVKARLTAEAFSGEGARRFGGRWNSPGRSVVYAAGSAALAMLEMLVHLESQELLRRYVIFELRFSDALVGTMAPADLPGNWRKSPPPTSVQRIGDRWLAQGATAVLRVPSVIVPGERNFVLNPAHRDYGKIVIGGKQGLKFDSRLVKKRGA